jgi:hypothetical protein
LGALTGALVDRTEAFEPYLAPFAAALALACAVPIFFVSPVVGLLFPVTAPLPPRTLPPGADLEFGT